MADYSVFSVVVNNPGISVQEIADATCLDVQDVAAIVGEWTASSIVTVDTGTISQATRVWYNGHKNIQV